MNNETLRIKCPACVASGERTVAFAAVDGTNDPAGEWSDGACRVCSWTPSDFMEVENVFNEVAEEEANHFADAPWQVLGLRIGRHLVGGYPRDPHGTVDALREKYLEDVDRRRPLALATAARRDWVHFLLLFGRAYREVAARSLIEVLSEPERGTIRAAMLELGA